MGYNTRVTGGFLANPHITWQEIKASPFEPSEHSGRDWIAPGIDLRLSVVEQTVDTDEGSLVRRTSNGLHLPHIDEYRARDLVEQVQKCIDMFPGHRWPGRLECEGEDNDDMWRVVVRDGRATRVEPRIVWPGEAAPEEKDTREGESTPRDAAEGESTRADVLAEVVAWLVKKAREYRDCGDQDASQADTLARMADKVSRGAVRPNNTATRGDSA